MNKNIFKYELDGQTFYADPLAVWDRLTISLGGDPFTACERAVATEGKSEVDVAHATASIYTAVVQAFELAPFDKSTGLGATMDDVTRIWNGLVQFNAECKKKRGG